MPEQHVFEYAVIRIVPRVEREEFINVGVVLYCAKQKFLGVRMALNEARLLALAPAIDVGYVAQNLRVFETICLGEAGSGPIGTLERAARFRWLTATRSTMLQLSKVHPGLCSNAAVTLDHLYAQLIL